MELYYVISKIPLFNCFLICIMSFKKWRVARACNIVAGNAYGDGNFDLYRLAKDYGDTKWAEIYKIDLEPNNKEVADE